MQISVMQAVRKCKIYISKYYNAHGLYRDGVGMGWMPLEQSRESVSK